MTMVSSETDILEQQTFQFCTFWLSGHLFGVDIQDVKEIHPDVMVTPIPHSAKEVSGYMNIRGQIHLILDLRLVMGFKEKKADSQSCLVIFKSSVAEPFGVMVDKVGDVVDVSQAQITEDAGQSVNNEMSGMKELLRFVCKLEKSLLLVLNSSTLLSTIERKKEDN